MEHAVATLVHLASSDEAARVDAMYQLVLVASAHESALHELAGPLCLVRLVTIARDALSSTPEVAALAAWIFARMADGQAVRVSEAPQMLDCLAKMLPSSNDRVRVASSRAVQALADASAEGRAIVLERGRQDPVFRAELERNSTLQPLAAAVNAILTTPGSGPSPSGPSTSGMPLGAAGQQQWKVLRIDGDLVLTTRTDGPRATTVNEVLSRSVVRPITELEPIAGALMSTADRAAATSNLNVAFKSYVEADSIAQAAMEQLNDQCEMLAEELLDEDSGESMDPELTEDSEHVQKALERVSQCRVTQFPVNSAHGAKTAIYLEELARRAKSAADASEAFVVKSIDEAGHYFGFELDDAPMDLEQLGEAAAKLCNALKKTGRVVYVGCNVRPKAQKKPGSPAGTAGTAGTGPGAPPAAHQQPRSAETC
jgi:hypothetical protein